MTDPRTSGEGARGVGRGAARAPLTPEEMRMQPGRAARALVKVTVPLAILELIVLVVRLIPWSRLLSGGTVEDVPAVGGGTIVVFGLVIAAVGLVVIGLAIASLVLAIIVAVQGTGLLRRGAIVLLIPLAMTFLFSIEISGDLVPEAVQAVSLVLETLRDLVELALTVVGLWFLVAGLRQLEQPPTSVGV